MKSTKKRRTPIMVWWTALLVLFATVLLMCSYFVAHTLLTKKPHAAVAMRQPIHRLKPTPTPFVYKKAQPDYVLPPIENGIAPVLTTIPTKQPVVFLGIDDGAFKDPTELKMLQDNHIRASLFLSNAFISDNPGFFTQFSQNGFSIENHTLHHYIDLPSRSYEVQKAEICGQADYVQQEYGRRPLLFRPPGGAYDLSLQKAAAACGMKAVINWIAKANGGSMQYQIGTTLRPGDIVLMHFRPTFKQDLQAFIDAVTAAGLHTERLEDWLM